MHKLVLLILVLLLLILHQDNWLWEDGTLVFGFMPIGLFFHACISVAASVTWLLAVKFCWPADLADSTGTATSGTAAQGGAK